MSFVSDFIPPPPDIVCGNGITTTNETRCLYRISEFGTMIGCRSLAHLQNCGIPKKILKLLEQVLYFHDKNIVYAIKNRFIQLPLAMFSL